LLFSLLMFLNYKIYCKKVNKPKRILKKQKNKSLLMQLILLTIFKCIILGLVFCSIKQKYNLAQKPIKVVGKNCFPSIEFFGDTYNSMELQTKSLQQWYAMSKIKFKSYNSFFQILLLLSGDIAMNPGPTSYPCSKCNRGVRSGILCTACNLWIHARCEGLDRAQVNILSRSGGNLGFVCCVCKENQSAMPIIDSTHTILGEQLELPQQLGVSAAPVVDSILLEGEHLMTSTLPFNETTLPENEQSFQFQEEQLQNVSLEDETQFFQKKGLHFVHLNCNSLLSKIDEIREFVLQNKPHVICFLRQNLTQLSPAQKF